ncbi:ABC transporter permease [Natrinema altunense]|uniref:ABC-2 type transporter n=1 Tax=Natrinema altunense (strain JCM 12890 / CGMCC 1.3731 / AJ2) TaxID=1227494 RepID=L9ZSJ6_NATA2|nr:ABC transporter permease [Natrinema altunense]ELY88148.1 ABC-2 type transporter [Natrinema altunense JCM 12890]
MSAPHVDRHGGSFASDVWVTFVRWTIKSVRNPFVLVVSLVQPIIFLVLFTQVFGGVATSALEGISYETYLVPAIVIQVALVAAATSGIGLVNDIENGMFEKTLVSPMNRSAVFLGKTLAEIVRIVVQVTIVLVLGVLLGAEIATGVVGAVAIVGICVLFSVWFTAFSNVLAVLTRDEESTIIGANLLQLPLLFVSSAFLPLPALPGWIRTVATFNPITYGVDAARAVMLGEDTMTVIEITQFDGMWNTLVPALAVLLGLALVFGSVAVYAIGRAASADVR